MRERAVGPVLRTEPPGVRIVNTHTSLVVAEVIPALRVAGRAVKVWTSVKQKKIFIMGRDLMRDGEEKKLFFCSTN